MPAATSTLGNRLGGVKRETQLIEFYLVAATLITYVLIFWLYNQDWSNETKLLIVVSPLASWLAFVAVATFLFRPLRYAVLTLAVAALSLVLAVWAYYSWF